MDNELIKNLLTDAHDLAISEDEVLQPERFHRQSIAMSLVLIANALNEIKDSLKSLEGEASPSRSTKTEGS